MFPLSDLKLENKIHKSIVTWRILCSSRIYSYMKQKNTIYVCIYVGMIFKFYQLVPIVRQVQLVEDSHFFMDP